MAKPHYPTAPKPPHHPKPPTGGDGGGSSSGGGSSTPGGGGSGGGSGKTKDPYASVLASQRKAQHAAAERAAEEARTLGLQAEALRAALGKDGFRKALDIKLQDVLVAQRQTDNQLLKGYRERVGSLGQAADDNEKSADGQSYANLTNRGRERANAMSEATAQGAGESDLLRAQQISLRNWNQNQSEVNRAYADTLTSINSSLTDLNVDTRTGRVNNALQAEADRGTLWTNYYGQVSETQTALGNTYGEMAAQYGAANEQVSAKKWRRKQKHFADQSHDAFLDASHTAGKAYESPGADKSLRAWKGDAAFEDVLNSGHLSNQGPEQAKPEGATLRSWT